jgi:hypothetical protein
VEHGVVVGARRLAHQPVALTGGGRGELFVTGALGHLPHRLAGGGAVDDVAIAEVGEPPVVGLVQHRVVSHDGDEVVETEVERRLRRDALLPRLPLHRQKRLQHARLVVVQGHPSPPAQ